MPSQQITKILGVDDQNTVSETLALVLHSRGYSVCTADSGREALRLLNDTPLHLVISDLTMPGMSGFELISAIRWRFPKMPVIAMSGTYTADQIPRIVDRFYSKGRQSAEALAYMVDELLSTPTATRGRLQARIPARTA